MTATIAMPFDIERIQALLPHRYPFLLVDRVVEFEPGKRILAWKNVTGNEPFFQGHFPGHPVMPGVLVLEALAQAGGLLTQMTRKGIQHRFLVFRLMHPVCFIVKFRLTGTIDIQLQSRADFFHVLTHHPSERYQAE